MNGHTPGPWTVEPMQEGRDVREWCCVRRAPDGRYEFEGMKDGRGQLRTFDSQAAAYVAIAGAEAS